MQKDINDVINITCHPQYDELKAALEFHIFVITYSGRFGGKTHTSAQIGIDLGIEYEGQYNTKDYTIILIAPEYETMRTGLRKHIEDHITDLDLWDSDYGRVIINNKKTIHIDLFSHIIKIEFKYGKKATNAEVLLKSIAFANLFIIDEGQLFPEDFYTFLKGTVREWGARVIINCNLNRRESWVYRMINEGGIENYNREYMKVLQKERLEEIAAGKNPDELVDLETLPKQYGSVYMPYYKNPFLPKDTLRMIEAHRISADPIEREWYLVQVMNQLPINSDLLIFPPDLVEYIPLEVKYDFNDRPFFIPQHQSDPYFITFIRGMDFGGTEKGNGHLGVVLEGFITQYKGIDKYGREGNISDLYIYRVTAKQMPDNKQYLEAAWNWTDWFKDRGEGFMDRTRAGALGQFTKGELGYPSLNVKAASQLPGSVHDSNMFIKTFNKIYVNLYAEKDISTGRLHCDNISFNFRNYRYEVDPMTNKPKSTNGQLVVRKLDDDVISALRYALDPYYLAERAKKERIYNQIKIVRADDQRYNPYYSQHYYV